MPFPEGDRWAHLVAAGTALDQARADELPRVLAERLASVLEVFPPGTDPVEDFPGAAVRSFVGALARALERGPPA